MQVDLRGMLLNAISAGRPRRAYYTFSINELLENLKELRQRHQAGDGDAALTEFFECYVVDDKTEEVTAEPKAACKPKPTGGDSFLTKWERIIKGL